MKKFILFLIVSFALSLASLAAEKADAKSAAPEKIEKSIFLDRNLEKAVRRQVFGKRDNDKPVTAEDVATVSIIEGAGLGITNLAGLEQCKALASLDLSRNSIADLSPIKDLTLLQYLNLAQNKIGSLSPLSGLVGLQYIELSSNHITELKALSGLTNLSAIYLGHNQIRDITPLTHFPRVSSLYLEDNQIQSLRGIGNLRSANSISVSKNKITDLSGIEGLNNLYHLFLDQNRITDLSPLVKICQEDKESRFAPFLNLYLKGNPLSGTARRSQLSALKQMGVRLND